MIKYLSHYQKTPEFWVMLPLIMVLIPHLNRLTTWLLILIFALLAWRVYAIKKPSYLPGKFILAGITLITTLGILFQYGTLIGKTAGTAFLVALLCIKLLESKQPRDFVLVITLSFFIIMTNFFFSQSIPTVIFMFITTIILLTGLCLVNQKPDNDSIKRSLIFSSRITLQALPLMLIMFVLFPRIPGPLWALPDEKQTGRTGLSETMTPGSLSQLIQNNDIAFRVNFKDSIPAQNKLYWRALVLYDFDGRSWTPVNNTNQRPEIELLSAPIEYTITLEPHDKKWLFALDIPTQAPANSQLNSDYLLRSTEPVNTLHQYSLSSSLNYKIGKRLSTWEKNEGIYLDKYKNQKTIALGTLWKQQFNRPTDIINRALGLFNQENFIYTLNPPLTPGFDPVDQFLFNTRKGFCEHYASSFTVLMRAAGIPARVVIGYQGGTLNPVNNVLTVRQSDAHAWSEVWIKDKGWVRVDPTAAIAPERIETNLDSALGSNELRPLYMRLNTGMIKQIRFYWDAIDNRWKQWVIGYGAEFQQQFLASILKRNISSMDLIKLLAISLLIATIIIFLIIVRSAKKVSLTATESLYADFCRKGERAGIKRHQHEGPHTYARRVITQLPAQSDLINQITSIYINSQYRSIDRIQHTQAMKKLIRQLKIH